MYRHLLVPVNGTDLSTHNASRAITLAKQLGAKITFFHARPDAATGMGMLPFGLSPASMLRDITADSNAILSKALTAARHAGVECEPLSKASEHPAQAIVDAAKECGCDLIFMSTRGQHGLRGLLESSQTEKVLRRSGISVLVSSVESQDPAAAANKAIAIIQDEHRSYAVVLRGMQKLLAEALANPATLDLVLLRGMLNYIEEFPEKLHHPKEELHIFWTLCERTMNYDGVITELKRQHAQEHRHVEQLRSLLIRLEQDEPDALQELAASFDTFIKNVWTHMNLEESTLLPAARQYLTIYDWQEIATAFENHRDPLRGREAETDMRKLFSRIAEALDPQKRESASTPLSDLPA